MLQKIKEIIKNSDTSLSEWLFVRYYEKREKRNVIKNEIPRIGDKNELDLYHRKWQKILKYKTPNAYRLYGSFISKDRLSIVSQVAAFKIEAILNPSKYIGYLSDKNNFSKLLPEAPFPETLLRKIWGTFYDKDYNYIPTERIEDVVNVIVSNWPAVIVKDSVESDSGRGVRLIKLEKHGDKLKQNEILKYKNELLDVIQDSDSQNLIIQNLMHQHKFLSQFNPTSINTIRVATYRSVKDNDVKILSTVIRLGASGKFIDNLHGGGHMVRVSDEGILADYCIDQYGTKFDLHNGIKTSGLRLPNFEKIKDLVKRLSARLTDIRLIQWDIMLDEEGDPKVIEYNCNGFSMWIAQMTGTPAFGDYTDEIIEYYESKL